MLTAILGATMMLTQNDIKKTLGFSTIGQMGYMIMECGLGAFPSPCSISSRTGCSRAPSF